MTYQGNGIAIAFNLLTRIFNEGENNMAADTVTTETPRAEWEKEPETSESIKAKIEEVKEAKRHQAETARNLARAEYEHEKTTERWRDLTRDITQIISDRLSYSECPDAVVIDGTLFVRTASNANHEGAYMWEWVLAETRTIDISADS
jgi:hypothetical protein